MLNPNLVERIRAIFLHDHPYVTIADAARMLGWSAAKMEAAIRDGAVELSTTRSGAQVDIRELAAKAMELWPLATIEEALGREALLVLPAGLRTRAFSARLPLYLINMLAFLAADGRETIDTFLTRELHGFAVTYKHRIGSAIPGFAEAFHWPNREAAASEIGPNPAEVN